MGQKGHKMGTLSGGQYDKQAHGGAGKGQKSLSPTAGPGRNGPTPHTGGAIVRDGESGHGSPRRGYQTDAHTSLHHGKHGEAIGHKNDSGPMEYTASLYSEGRPTSEGGTGPNFVPKHDHGTKGSHATAHPLGHTTKAEHHPPAMGTAHKFSYMTSREAHGYSYAPSQHDGPLRNSGHAKAHRIGKK